MLIVLPYISSRRVGDADLVAQRLGHLAAPVGADEDRHRQDRLLGLAVGALDVAPEQQVELLVGAPQLDVGVAPPPSHSPAAADTAARASRSARAADQRLAKSSRSSSCATVVVRTQRQQLGHRHVQPLAVAPHLQALGVGVEDPQRLLLEGRGVGLDLLLGEHRAQARAPRGVAHARGVVADDQHHPVAGVLELAQLAQHDRVAEVDVGRRRVDPELDPQRPALRARALAACSASAPSGRLSTALRGRALRRPRRPRQWRSAWAANARLSRVRRVPSCRVARGTCHRSRPLRRSRSSSAPADERRGSP